MGDGVIKIFKTKIFKNLQLSISLYNKVNRKFYFQFCNRECFRLNLSHLILKVDCIDDSCNK